MSFRLFRYLCTLLAVLATMADSTSGRSDPPHRNLRRLLDFRARLHDGDWRMTKVCACTLELDSLLAVESCKENGQSATLSKFLAIDIFLDRMDFILPGTDRDRGHTTPEEPVGVEAAI
jgi:hypothetical protein